MESRIAALEAKDRERDRFLLILTYIVIVMFATNDVVTRAIWILGFVFLQCVGACCEYVNEEEEMV